jgi:cyclase
VNVPVIAHGGAGNFKHIYDVIKKTNISGVGLSSILHYEAINNFPRSKLKIGNTNFVNNFKRSNKRRNVIDKLKKYLKKRKIKVRDE